MLKKIIVFALFFFNSASFAALAQSSGPFVEVNIGSNSDFDLASHISLGYKINDFFAVEGGGATYSGDNNNHYLFNLAFKGIVPFSNGFNIFAKFGGAKAHGVNGFKSVVYYGAGAGYSFTPNVTGVLQWNTTTENNGVEAPNLFFVGLNYSF